MHNLVVPSFFFTNNTGAPQGDTFGQMKPLSTRSCNYVFNSFNSVEAILYDGIKMRANPSKRSMLNSNSLSSGNLGKSLKNTFKNSHTTGTFFKIFFGVECRLHVSNMFHNLCAVIALLPKPRSRTWTKFYDLLQIPTLESLIYRTQIFL